MSTCRLLGLRFAQRSMNIIRHLKVLHKRAFSERYLLLTNVSISLGLSTAGDVLEQQYELMNGELTHWDSQRTINMGVSGMGTGVICHFWYKFLDRHMPGRTLGVVMKKIVLDQLICSPLYISVFFFSMGLLENKTRSEVWEEMRQKGWKLYVAEWMVWPPAQFVNFYWLPARYRVIYDNLISLGYDVYTSQVKNHA